MALAVKHQLGRPVANLRSTYAFASKTARDEIADTRCDVAALTSRSSRGPEPT